MSLKSLSEFSSAASLMSDIVTSENGLVARGSGPLFEFEWEGVGWGGGGRLLTFSAFRMGTSLFEVRRLCTVELPVSDHPKCQA